MLVQLIKNVFKNRIINSVFFTIFSFAIAIFYLSSSNIFEEFELRTLDYRFSLRGTKPVASDIAIVFIGNQDIEEIGIWPWRRYYHALLIDILKKNGVRQVGFDILFTDSSKKEFIEDDEALAFSTEAADNIVYISFFGYFEEMLEGREWETPEADLSPLPPSLEKYTLRVKEGQEKFFRKATKQTLPIPPLLSAAQSIGFADCLPDDDGVTRKLPLLVNYNGRLYMSFTLAMVCDYLGITKDNVKVNPGESIVLKKNDEIYTIPVNEKGEMIINYRHRLADFRAYSYNQLLQSEMFPDMAVYDLNELKDRIAVVGTTYTGNTDLRPTPLDPAFPFLCVQATAIDNILQKDFIYRPGLIWRILIALFFYSVVIFLCIYTRPAINSGIVILSSVAYLYFAVAVFKTYGLWLDMIFPFTAIIWPYVVVTTVHYIYAFVENVKYLERMKYLGNLVESSHDAIFSFDLTGNIISWNSGAKQIYGYEIGEVLGRSWEIFVPNEKMKPLTVIMENAKNGCSTINYETNFIIKDGGTIPVNISASPIISAKGETSGVSIISQDLTERKRLMEQIMESEKLAEVGRLSAGLAHEMKNPLTPIIFYAQNLETASDLKLEEVHSQAKIISSEADRILHLATDLLSFSRPKDDEMKPIDVNKVVEDTLLLIVYQARKLGAEVKKDLADNLKQVKGESDKLKQVLINLVMNAAHAMNGKKGTITVSTRNTGENGREFVEVAVADTGSGMSQNVKDNLFKPFFTTKAKGVGTGLGLYISYNIIKQHGGMVTVESEEGVGTTFFLKFPAV